MARREAWGAGRPAGRRAIVLAGVLAGLLGGLAGALPKAAVAADLLQVAIDHAKIVKLPTGAATVVIGNPGIADVAVQKSGVMVVTGKTYGTTNLIALDASGEMIGESMIRVEAARDATVVVQRGLERESYSCTPTCQPAVSLGDAEKYFGGVTSQAGARNGFAGANASSAAPPKGN